ncbi:MAG: hypothetical protein AAF548_00480 [Actinomycetota bacterium]
MPTLQDLPANIAAEFGALVDGVWDGRVDPGLLEACRRRVCELLGAPADTGRHRTRPTPATDDPALADLLAFVEMWVIDPHAVTDDQAAAVRTHLDDRQVASFTIGLATIEALARAELALERTR